MNDRNNKMTVTRLSGGIALASLAWLTACATGPGGSASTDRGTSARAETLYPRVAASAPILKQEPATAALGAPERDRVKMSLGNNRTFRIPQATPAGNDEAGPITLNVENGDIREIVRNMIGDALGEGFVIDPAVSGTVTVRTAKGIKRSDVIPTLEMLLRTVKAVLVKDGNYWRILPEGGANLGTTAPRIQLRPGNGNSVVILPVLHIGAKELERVMAPFAKPPSAASIRVDELRNLLFLTGTETEIRNLLEIAEMFDVNLMAGMSFLIYPLESADVKSVAADWEKIFPAATNPFAGLLRLVPIERMNAILLISPQSDVIREARQWLERLDKGSDAGGGARLYVYNVLYTQAEKLQATLQQALSGRANPSSATVAPGQISSTLTSPISPIAGQGLISPGNTINNPPPTVIVQRPTPQAQGAANNQAIGLARNATVIADKDRNALLIVATPAEYSAIESAIKKLDTAPKMIAIEVQIAQVGLTGAFTYGISGMFTGKPESNVNRLTSEGGVGLLNQVISGSGGSGFSYTWQGAAAKAILNTLQTTGQSKTLASPTMITLDNQKVSFTNGTQISVRTQSTVANGTTQATDSFQYINTGLTINITPRVSGNNVFLEIQQQNSNALPNADKNNPNPDISQNSQQTTVMVANGDTMLLSGLFIDTASKGTDGLPLLSTIPVFGGLFGNQSWSSNRSELIMLVTPRVMASVEDTRGVVDELRQRLGNIETILPQVGTRELPTASEARQELKQRRAAEAIPSEFNQSLKVQPNNAER
ncbi:MAG: secretin N-terminal domain-containing protein [Casimicrobium sp.]